MGLVIMFFNLLATGQSILDSVEFQFVINGEQFKANHFYSFQNTADSVLIETARFYIFNLTKNDQRVYGEHILIDLNSVNKVPIQDAIIREGDSLSFSIGVDSTLQYLGAQSGDLDPMHGMYWTWKNGYIHVKLEGQRKSVDGETVPFFIHLGGYQAPFNSIQSVSCIVEKENVVSIHLNRFLDKFDIRNQDDIMSPGRRAVKLSEYLSHLFNYSDD